MARRSTPLLPEYALTIRQPFAWAILHSTKRFENRTWRPPKALLGQRFAIHTSYKPVDWFDVEFVRSLTPKKIVVPLEYDVGAIVGTAKLVDVVEKSRDPWFDGPLAFVLDDVRTLREPISCKGTLHFWRIPHALRTQRQRRRVS